MNADLVAAATEQVAAVAMLHELNAEYIRAFVESDVDWYEEHLSEDFVCTLTDGRRIAKAEFLRQIEKGPGVTNVSNDQVDVQPLGEVALVHGVTHYRRDGFPVSTRYIDVWRSRDGRWQAVAAQLTTVTRPMSSDGCDRL